MAIVEDNATVRDSLTFILNGSPGFLCVCTCSTAEEALKKIPQMKPDVVLMDLHLPVLSGIECVRRLTSQNPNLQIIMLTIEENSERVFQSLEAGASGYLVKTTPPAEILAAIEEVNRGGSPMSSQIARMVVRTFQKRGESRREEENLTQRENEVLNLVCQGYRSKEIAETLSIKLQTVETHVRNIYNKLHVRSRVEAVTKFLNTAP